MGGLLKDKVAIITGAASGMGAETSRRFIAEGARVLLTDVNEDGGRALATELGERAAFQRLDVSSAGDWQAAVDAAETAFGPVQVLMNNAGFMVDGYIEKFDPIKWERALSAMLLGPLLGMQAVTPSMRAAGGGSIINISSLQGREAEAGAVPYIAAKSGLRGLTKAATIELGRLGIRVNAIFPGLIVTGITHSYPLRIFGKVPLERPEHDDSAGRPADIAGVTTYLASDRSRYVTGNEIVVDGGKSVRFPTSFFDYRADVAELRAAEAEKEGASA